MSARLTQKQALQNLETKHNGAITVKDSYFGSTKKHTFSCTACQHSWQAVWNNVANIGTGCPKCATKKQRGTRYSSKKQPNYKPAPAKVLPKPEHVLAALTQKSIRFVGGFNPAYNGQTLACQICQHVWVVSWRTYKACPTGCPSCHTAKQSNSHRALALAD